MKKIVYLFSVLLVLSFLSSCDKQVADEPDVSLKTAYVDYYTTPLSSNQVIPAVLAVDKPRGGNVTCADVEQAFKTSLICGNKIDFTNETEFEAAFPAWLNVQVDGIYVSFSIDGCGEIEGVPVKVGAVIVKGSNSASVYYYPDGTTSDSHLAAPGDKYMVSNLTFCFVECKKPQVAVAVKSWYWKSWPLGDGYSYALSSADNYLFESTDWCQYLGINLYPEKSSFAMLDGYTHENIGSVTIQEGNSALTITIDLNDGSALDHTYLYIGDIDAIDLSSCPDYPTWLQNSTNSNTHTFVIPY